METKQVHAQLARLYEVAKAAGRLSQSAGPAELARLLNISRQLVHHWETRGPSKTTIFDLQAEWGVNATWILSGSGPMFIGGSETGSSQWPFKHLDIRRVQRLTPEDRAFLEGKLDSALEALESRIDALPPLAQRAA